MRVFARLFWKRSSDLSADDRQRGGSRYRRSGQRPAHYGLSQPAADPARERCECSRGSSGRGHQIGAQMIVSEGVLDTEGRVNARLTMAYRSLQQIQRESDASVREALLEEVIRSERR